MFVIVFMSTYGAQERGWRQGGWGRRETVMETCDKIENSTKMEGSVAEEVCAVRQCVYMCD